MAMVELPVHRFARGDGVSLAYREVGEGRPLILIHGFVSNAALNWVRFGTAQALAERGRRVILLDLRAHGDSSAPRDRTAYAPDVLVDDALAFVEHLGIDDYDIGGYSLGGRTVVRMLVRGARPRRAVVAGMGLDGIVDVGPGTARFARTFDGFGTFERNSPGWFVETFVTQNDGDPEALMLALRSSVDTPAEEIARIDVPTLVVVGVDDVEHASAEALAELLPRGRFATVPGNHMSAVTKPELAAVMGDFLDAPDPV